MKIGKHGTQDMELHNAAQKRVPLSLRQIMQVDFKVMAEKPRTARAYALCVFLGMFGAHRFYLGDRRTGKTMLVIGMSIIGLPVSLVWALADLFRIPAMVDRQTKAIRARHMAEATG